MRPTCVYPRWDSITGRRGPASFEDKDAGSLWFHSARKLEGVDSLLHLSQASFCSIPKHKHTEENYFGEVLCWQG